MKHHLAAFLLLLACCALPSLAFAQGCCSGGTPTSGSFNLQPIAGKEGLVVLYGNYNRMDALYSQEVGMLESNVFRATGSLLLQANYGLTDRLAIGVTLPYIRQILGNVVNDNAQITNGLGDVLLTGQYKVFQAGDHSVLAGGGIKLPTGFTRHQLPGTEIYLAPDLQSGTGSFDGLVGVQHQWVHVGLPGATLSSRVIYKIPGGSRRFDGQQFYRFGHEWQAFVSWAKPFYLKGNWEPALTLRYRQTTPDVLEVTQVPNTGGHWLFLFPSLQYGLGQKAALLVGGQIPLIRGVSGLQFITSYSLTASLQVRLGKGSTPVFGTFD